MPFTRSKVWLVAGRDQRGVAPFWVLKLRQMGTCEMGPPWGGGGRFIGLVMPSCLQLSSPCLSSLPLHASITKQIMAPAPFLLPCWARHRSGSAKSQGVTKRCRLSWQTNSALVYKTKFSGGGGSSGVSANEYTVAQINFGDLTPY